MIVLTHISIAFASMLLTSLAYFQPSKTKLKASLMFVALTLASGTYLVVSTHSNMLSACVSGLTYLGIVGLGLVLAARRLAADQKTS